MDKNQSMPPCVSIRFQRMRGAINMMIIIIITIITAFIPSSLDMTSINPSVSQVTAYIQDQILISGSINLFDTESYKRPAKSDRSPTIQCRGEYQWAHNKLLAINQGLCVWHQFIYYAPKHCQYTIHHWRTAWYFRWLVGQGSQEVHAAAPSIA